LPVADLNVVAKSMDLGSDVVTAGNQPL